MELLRPFAANPNPQSAHDLVHSTSAETLLSGFLQHPEGRHLMENLAIFTGPFQHFLAGVQTEGVLAMVSSEKLQRCILQAFKDIDMTALPIDMPRVSSALVEAIKSEENGNLAKILLSDKYFQLLKDPSIASQVIAISSSAKSVILLRVVEMAIAAGNKDSEIFEILGEVLNKGFEMFTSDDLLSRLSSIEVIGELGNSQAGCQKLLNPRTLSSIKQTLEDPMTDEYTKGYMTELACKIYMYTGDASLFDDLFWEYLTELLSSSQANRALSALFLISSRSASLFVGKRALILNFAMLQTSNDAQIKKTFYETIAQMLRNGKWDDVKEIVKDLNLMDGILREFRTPFEDLTESVLRLVNEAVKFKQIGEEMFKVPEFAEFTLVRKAHSNEVAHLKFEIVKSAAELDLDELLKAKIREYLQHGVFAPLEFSDQTMNNAS